MWATLVTAGLLGLAALASGDLPPEHDRPLYDDLKNVMPYEPVIYSPPNVSVAYKSTTKFNPKGMGHLYMVTSMFMQYIQKGDPLPKGFLTVKQGQLDVVGIKEKLKTDWPKVLHHYAGPLLLAMVTLLFGIVMPCAGFLFCCCRCSGKCGARSHAYDKKHDPCKRAFLGIILATFATVILFGVVCAFVTNEYMHDGAHELPDNVRTGLGDTELYLSNTKEEVNTLLVTNYRELQTVLNDILEGSGQIVKDKLADVSKAVALNNLTAIATGLTKIKGDLSDISTITRELQQKSQQLNAGLVEIKQKLTQRLRECQQPCREALAKYNIHGLSANADFSRLPNLSGNYQNISLLIDSNIGREVMKGKRAFDEIQFRIQHEVNTTIPRIKQAIQNAGKACEDTAHKITNVLDKVNQKIPQHVNGRISQGERYINEYAIYRYYVDTTVSSLLLLILVCLTFGLFYGFCGKKVDLMYGTDDYCCNKGTGGRYLMAGVYLMFLFAIGLAAVAVMHLLVGIVAEKTVCESLKEPSSDNQVMTLVDQLVNMDHVYPKGSTAGINVTHMISSCHRNESMYQVLNLEAVVNVSQVSQFQVQYGIVDEMAELQKQIKLSNDVTILTADAKVRLLDLASSSLSDIDFTAYNDLVENQITSIDLKKLAHVINETTKKLKPDRDAVYFSLINDVMYIESFQTNVVDKMVDLSKKLRVSTNNLQEDLKFNHTSLRQAIHQLLREVDDAQDYLQKQGPEEVVKLAQIFVDEFTQHINNYLQRVVRTTKYSIGKCWPISQAYNATVISMCSKVVNPFNGFWLSIGWSLALFLPCILVCVALASLYSKSNTYLGPLDTDMYDAYGDRDNIPLNVHDKKYGGGGHHRSNGGHQAFQETYENQNGYDGDYSGGASGGGHGVGARGRRPMTGEGSRYRDAAATPKHWDFPAGGPPHYRSPPPGTEYERPPPYYYPGPGVAVASARLPPDGHQPPIPHTRVRKKSS
ncbi:prominin-like protein isoform X2 [Neocloeon triangulifer]|uniref:prominin-like protein isoform X2 n=1 Tax=Neocloeon triangulifer TaxID=2078957 RepID=UPI00286F3F1C|nr:prominin-like protein isoform X2 [Neocloeon triangulifer]